MYYDLFYTLKEYTSTHPDKLAQTTPEKIRKYEAEKNQLAINKNDCSQKLVRSSC